MDNYYWFRQKYWGYGTGLPLNWKGWAHLFVLLAGVLGGIYLIQHGLPARDRATALIVLAVFFVGPMVLLAWRKTEGGWRWRS